MGWPTIHFTTRPPKFGVARATHLTTGLTNTTAVSLGAMVYVVGIDATENPAENLVKKKCTLHNRVSTRTSSHVGILVLVFKVEDDFLLVLKSMWDEELLESKNILKENGEGCRTKDF